MYSPPVCYPANLAFLTTAQNRNLVAVFDIDLSFEKHRVSSSRASCSYQIRSLLSPPDLHEVINAFILSRLDYYNAPYSCISKISLYQLQVVQNAAAPINLSITPVLTNWHWLPVYFTLIKALNGPAPNYVTDLLTPYLPGCSSRLAHAALLPVLPFFVAKGDGVPVIRARHCGMP